MRLIKQKTDFSRAVGLFLILYGVLGLTASLYFIVHPIKTTDFFPRYSELSDQLTLSATIIEKTELASKNAAISIRNAKTSLNSASNVSMSMGDGAQNAEQAMGIGANVTSEVGAAFYRIAGYMDFTILGWKPLESTVSYFNTQGDKTNNLSHALSSTALSLNAVSGNMKDLGGELQSTASNLEENAKNMDEISKSLGELSKNTRAIANSLAETDPLEPLNRLKNIFLMWFAFLHLALSLIGVILLKK